MRQRSFKPYYNWNTFNTEVVELSQELKTQWVLNLIITGIPSIHCTRTSNRYHHCSFKPYYNWNTFNTGYTDEEIDEIP